MFEGHCGRAKIAWGAQMVRWHNGLQSAKRLNGHDDCQRAKKFLEGTTIVATTTWRAKWLLLV